MNQIYSKIILLFVLFLFLIFHVQCDLMNFKEEDYYNLDFSGNVLRKINDFDDNDDEKISIFNKMVMLLLKEIPFNGYDNCIHKENILDINSDDIKLISIDKHDIYHTLKESKDEYLKARYTDGQIRDYRFGSVYNIDFEMINSLFWCLGEESEEYNYKNVHKILLFEDVDGVLFIIKHYFNKKKDDIVTIDLTSIEEDEKILNHPENQHYKDDNNNLPNGRSGSEFSIVNYNIWNFNEDWNVRCKRLVDQILNEKPKIVLLQEVRYDIIQEFKRNYYLTNHIPMDEVYEFRSRFQIEQIKQLLLKDQRTDLMNTDEKEGKDTDNYTFDDDDFYQEYKSMVQWQYVYDVAMTYLETHINGFHVDEGLAIFSQYPIIDTHRHLLSRDFNDNGDAHQRAVQHVEIDLSELQKNDDNKHHTHKATSLHIFQTHTTLSEKAQKRNVLEIWDIVNQYPLPQLLIGDMNSEESHLFIKFLTGKSSINNISGDFIDVWDSLYFSDDHHNNQPDLSEQEINNLIEQLEFDDDNEEYGDDDYHEEEEEDNTKHIPKSRSIFYDYSFLAWEPKKRIDFVLLRNGNDNELFDVIDLHLIGEKYLRSDYNLENKHDQENQEQSRNKEKLLFEKEFASDHFGLSLVCK
eukprot:TRINITY_DN13749_c0_g1_i1.p1 TRINITY_DN13749_c0_g1~~TRINITY_DN13749_c0_g1_i1.p1  ORF type:complete len:635 (+),score=184.38 TRINITY_DN13749_c0_g1_i1:87-1991(+)